MNNKQNLHTHTVFCDGRNTPEELIAEAVSRGFDSIGFSMHCDPAVGIGKRPDFPERFEKYKREIRRLQREWRDRFPVFLGIEYDIYSEWAEYISDCDFAIGSVHYLHDGGGELIKIDLREPSALADCIENSFDGDFMKFAASYYRSLAELATAGDFDIVGHFDLLTKHIDRFPDWDTESKAYRLLALEAIDALSGKIPFFEVNTGAIARGYRTAPYPDKFILKALRESGFGAVISTDCHNKEYLDLYMEESRELLRECGFNSRFILTHSGFKEVEL